jgi:hypothetical protein
MCAMPLHSLRMMIRPKVGLLKSNQAIMFAIEQKVYVKGRLFIL